MCKAVQFVLIAITFIFLYQSAFGQMDSSAHYFKEIGWTIKPPPDFTVVDSATREANIAKGKIAMEGSSNITVNTNHLKNLISISKGRTNYFSANLTQSTSITSENWEQVDKSAKNIFLNTFIKQLPNSKIDTTNFIQAIDGIDFKTFQATFIINEKVSFHTVYLSKFYKEYGFTISYFYVDSAAGDEISNMLKNSRFNK